MRGFWRQCLNGISANFEGVSRKQYQNQSLANNYKETPQRIGFNVFNIIFGKCTMLKFSKESNSTTHDKKIYINVYLYNKEKILSDKPWHLSMHFNV